MSQKIKAPNQKSHGFAWGITAIIVIVVVVIAAIVISKRNTSDGSDIQAESVNFDVSYKDGTITLKSPTAAADAPVADIFEDYACPHCAELVEADHEDMLNALNEGKLVVNLETVNILDGTGPNFKAAQATMGGAVQMAIAESGNADAFWTLHDYIFLNQSDVYRSWDFNKYADVAESLGVDADTVSAIRDESVQDTYLPTLQSNVTRMTDKGVEGTPAVFVNGEQYQLQKDPSDATKVKSWVPDALAAKK